jgi:hypothetical protein
MTRAAWEVNARFGALGFEIFREEEGRMCIEDVKLGGRVAVDGKGASKMIEESEELAETSELAQTADAAPDADADANAELAIGTEANK